MGYPLPGLESGGVPCTVALTVPRRGVKLFVGAGVEVRVGKGVRVGTGVGDL